MEETATATKTATSGSATLEGELGREGVRADVIGETTTTTTVAAAVLAIAIAVVAIGRDRRIHSTRDERDDIELFLLV